MKPRSFASVACCSALLIVTVPRMAQAASNSLLSDAEPQYASKLCWAAADVLAVNHFYPICPSATSTSTATPALFPTSQALDAAYYEWSQSGEDFSHFPHFLWEVCGPQIGNCNDWAYPLLQGLDKNKGFAGVPPTTGDNSVGLTWDAAKQEIDAGRPFLFTWDYPENDTRLLPVGKHQLVATGYSDERDSSGTQYLQIWDPWPVPLALPSSVPACGPAPGVLVTPEHSRWVYFSTYTGPWVEMGLIVTPLHEDDLWHLAVKAPSSAPAPPSPPVVSIDGGTPPPPPPPTPHPPPTPLAETSFAEALSTAVPQSRQLNLQVSGAAPRTLGVPFPIVGLGFKKLLGAADDPTALLAGMTSAILFPVESQSKVVDAFLLLFVDGRWQVGGYANLEITQRLVAFRARYAAQKHLRVDSFYMVSVPGEVAFFAAYGKGKSAILIPASTDPTIDAVAGKAVLADKQLRKLVVAIQSDLQRYRGRVPDTVRPRPQ
jgi:hypothetical protein